MNLINVSRFLRVFSSVKFSFSWSHFSFWFYSMSFSHFAYHSYMSSFFLSFSHSLSLSQSLSIYLIFIHFFLLLFCSHLIFVLYLFFRQCWDIFMLRHVYFIYDARVFHLFNLLVWRSTNTNCEYFMNGKSSFRIKLFCDSIFNLHLSVCANVRILFFFLIHFILKVKDFLKPYCLLFGFYFFPLYSTLFVYLRTVFFILSIWKSKLKSP